MGEILESGSQLQCPECQAVLAEERRKFPWCECGWSSAPADWNIQHLPPALRGMLNRNRQYARRLAAIDQQAAHLLERPWGKWLWRLYLAASLLLSIPVITAMLLLFGLLLAGWGYAIYRHSWVYAIIMAALTGTMLLYQWLTRPERDVLGIELDRRDASLLFKVLDEEAARLHTAPIDRVSIQLNSNVSIQQKAMGLWRPHLVKQLDIGLLSLFALTMSQFKAVIAHELGHIRQKDTLVIWPVNHAQSSLQGLALDTWSLLNLLRLSGFVGLLFLPVHFVASMYLRLLVWVSRWAQRRQEYTADRIAAQRYGKWTCLEALISLGAIGIGFEEHIPAMIEKIRSNYDRRDYYNQFVDYWVNTLIPVRQKYYARAVASFSTVFDTHPSYQDRYRMLQYSPDNPVTENDGRSALVLLPNAAELGHQLTVQMLKKDRLVL